MSAELWQGRVCRRIRDNGVVLLESLEGHEYHAATVLLSGGALTADIDVDGFHFVRRHGMWTRFWRGDVSKNSKFHELANLAERADSPRPVTAALAMPRC